jgi:uncharacterized protein (TIGR03118 family)
MIEIIGLYRRTTLATVGVCLLSGVLAQAQKYDQVNLVTDDKLIHPGVIEDPDLVNAWGISYSPTSPFWVSDNGTGLSTLYKVDPVTGAPTKQGLVVTIQGAGNPTGQAFNPLAGSGAFNKDNFLFVSEDGTISGWRGALGTTAEVLATGSADNVYKGTAFGSDGTHGYLYAANFRSGKIDVLKGDPGAPDLAGSFTDPNLPSGFAPFNIRNLGGKLYVTYAMQDGTGHDDVAGAGNGFVDAYDLQGNLLGRVATQGSLNSPWGLEIAPASFGPLAGDLLVGNFGDGTINAFDLNGNVFEGQVSGPNGTPLSIDGLWALTVGNGGSGGRSDRLYFTAGPDDEKHGLFGVLGQVPDGGSALALLVMGLSGMAIVSRRIRN